MTPELRARILKHVKDGDTVTDEDCWVWTGLANSGTPVLRVNKTSASVRRMVLTEQGVKLGKRIATTRCLTPLCVSPGCCVAMSVSQLHHRRVAKWGPMPASARLRCAVAARAAVGKLTAESVAAIRADTRPGAVVARDHGVTRQTISQIRRGVAWRHAAASPFAGLGTP